LKQTSEQAARPGGFFIGRQVRNKQEPAVLSTTDDLRIRELKELSTPEEVMREVPRTW